MSLVKGAQPPVWPIFKYVNLHYQQIIYTPYINLIKFEPPETSNSGDISHLVFKTCEAAIFGPKTTMFILKTLILPAYILA